MKTSESTKSIIEALSKVQAALQPVVKDAENPHFRSKYATLEAVVEASRDLLLQNGICILQIPTFDETGSYLVTRLCHSSGEWIEGKLKMAEMDSPQRMGSLLSYYRRYMLSTMVGIVTQEDDDAEKAEQGNSVNITRLAPPKQVEPKSSYNRVQAPTPMPSPIRPKTPVITESRANSTASSHLADSVIKVGIHQGKKFSELTRRDLVMTKNWIDKQPNPSSQWLNLRKDLEVILETT